MKDKWIVFAAVALALVAWPAIMYLMIRVLPPKVQAATMPSQNLRPIMVQKQPVAVEVRHYTFTRYIYGDGDK